MIEIGRRYCGPPNSGNGGYVCGVVARDIAGPATSVLSARVPLDLPLDLASEDGVVRLTGTEGELIGRASAADPLGLPAPPAAPSLAEAGVACAAKAEAHRFHPICFTCGPERAAGDGLRVFVGQLAGRPTGEVAGVWTPDAAFADADGLVASEVVWAALDCPGFFAWVAKEGRHGALLGTMTCEVLRRPKVGEPTIVLAWPLERQGRKETAGVALFGADGELLARAHQVWVTMATAFPPPAAQADAVTA